MFRFLDKLFKPRFTKEETELAYSDTMTEEQFVAYIKFILGSPNHAEKDARRAVYKRNKKQFLDWKKNRTESNFGDYQEFLDGTTLYSQATNVSDCGTRYESTRIGCINADCVDVAEQLLRKGYNPAILNLASAKHPGGGYHRGSSAQEESLCRSSNLILSLYQYADPDQMACVAESGVPIKEKHGYPLDINFGGIYTPAVTFFRHGKSKCFALRENAFQCDVITVAALSFTGRSDYSGQYETRFRSSSGGFTEEGEGIMLNKIRTIFRMGVKHGKDALVLGAFGCGAYRLPIPEVVRLFNIVIHEPEFANKFRVLVFAILERNHTPSGESGKFSEFYNVFGTYTPD